MRPFFQRLRGAPLLVAGLSAICLSSSALPATAGSNIALVLDVEDYSTLGRSEIGIKRGDAVQSELEAKGFDSVLLVNPKNAVAHAAFKRFADKALHSGLAIVVLMGHGLGKDGQTFFLPANAEIDRASDLFSNGMSINNIGQIAGRASNGAVCFMMSSPIFTNSVEGVDMRPQLESAVASNVSIAFSLSAKVPVSRVQRTAQQTADSVVALLQQPHPSLAQLMQACTGERAGALYGKPSNIDLSTEQAPSIRAETTPGDHSIYGPFRDEEPLLLARYTTPEPLPLAISPKGNCSATEGKMGESTICIMSDSGLHDGDLALSKEIGPSDPFMMGFTAKEIAYSRKDKDDVETLHVDVGLGSLAAKTGPQSLTNSPKVDHHENAARHRHRNGNFPSEATAAAAIASVSDNASAGAAPATPNGQGHGCH